MFRCQAYEIPPYCYPRLGARVNAALLQPVQLDADTDILCAGKNAPDSRYSSASNTEPNLTVLIGNFPNNSMGT